MFAPYYYEALTLDGLVLRLSTFRYESLTLRQNRRAGGAEKRSVHALSSFQRTKDFGVFTAVFPPRIAPSILLDFAPALFGGTFQTYDDFPSLVNPFLACSENLGAVFRLHRRCGQEIEPGSAMF